MTTNNNVKVAIIGECMAELQKTADRSYYQSFGGDTYNTAVYLKQLFQSDNKQLEVSYITGVGESCPFSADFVALLNKYGLDTSHVTKHKNNLGLYLINVDANGERTFSYWRDTAPAKYCLENYSVSQLTELLAGYNYVYLSGVTLAILTEKSRELLFATLKQLKATTTTQVLFDNNYRPRLWASLEQAQNCYRQMLSYTDIAFLTYDDDCALWGYDLNDEQCSADLLATAKLGVKEIIIKRGAQPCYGVTVNNQQEQQVHRVVVKANKVTRVVDTTAAGDSFSGGYLSQRLAGADVATSIAFAHKVAATVIQYKGAIIPDTALEELRSQAQDFTLNQEQLLASVTQQLVG